MHCSDIHHYLMVTPLYFQSGFLSGSLTPLLSNHWISKPSPTTHVPPGGESSLWKTTTMKVRFHKNCSHCSASTYCMTTTNPTTLLGLMQPGLCHWSISSGALWWHVTIGSATEARCAGISSLAEERLTAVSCHYIAWDLCCGAFCKYESQRGRVLSGFLK